jgi:DNA-binding CsgD family transcriptional regulator
MRSNRLWQREKQMLALYRQGLTLKEIGLRFGISGQAVQQSLKRLSDYSPRPAKRRQVH